MRNWYSGFPTSPDTNQAVQPSKMARGLKGFVLLRRAISLKVNYENVIILNCVFAITIVIMNGHKCQLFENIINDVKNMGNGEINVA